MNSITHTIDKDGNVVIEATWDNNTYGAVIVPRIIDGIAHIPQSLIDTNGLSYPEEMKKKIISFVTTQRGKNKEAPIVVDDDKEMNSEIAV